MIQQNSGMQLSNIQNHISDRITAQITKYIKITQVNKEEKNFPVRYCLNINLSCSRKNYHKQFHLLGF